MAKNKQDITPFHERLALNQWLLHLFEAENFNDLAKDLKSPQREYWDADKGSGFFRILTAQKERKYLLDDTLRQYDSNILQHTNCINKRRDRPIEWKYFQYLALLFTEIYLDQYFSNPDKMRDELNQFLSSKNELELPEYQPSDLSKVAFWSATGSGKTLLMHANVLQYHYYLEKHNRQKNLNRIILLTPNEGLSRQHLEELNLSSLEARIFDKNAPALISDKPIEIIEITKLDDKMGDTKVAVESFEENNLVLVDEGHRGGKGEAWMGYRKRLCQNGFSFEYSATFGQAFGSSDSQLTKEYAKSILFDYSYKFFYRDGYGKNFHVLNYADRKQGNIRQIYLTACLLSFYQQLREYEDRVATAKKYNIEKPLWIFVGHSVYAISKKNNEKVSDVLDIILFLAEFFNNPTQSKERIQSILAGSHGLLDDGKDVFGDKFDYLKKLRRNKDFFKDIRLRLFNSRVGGKLRLEHLTTSGEIILKVGDGKPFAVINVGDPTPLRNLCNERSDEKFMVSADNAFAPSYFDNINESDSTINILIGAKKFIEGWNSWRVSTMGLLNVGKSEGTQIIQLFGRGVRLKGENLSLKRSNADEVKRLEILNVFGIKANYMKQFYQYLEKEGVSPAREIYLPVVLNFSNKKKLKIMRVKDGLDYKRDSEKKPRLFVQKNTRFRVTLDLYSHIRSTSSRDISSSDKERRQRNQAFIVEKNEGSLDRKYRGFLDVNKIYLDVEQLKEERGWHNLCISREDIDSLLKEENWYTLYIPDMHFKDFSEGLAFWQEAATNLMKRYTERCYKAQRSRWEQQHLTYQDLQIKEANLLWSNEREDHQYTLEINSNEQDVIDKIMSLKKSIKSKKMQNVSCKNFIFFKKHLYEPLIATGNGLEDSIIIRPVPLNEGEDKFVRSLMQYVDKDKTSKNEEFYLLRNQSKKGFGFFETHGFYPDFILWIVLSGKQYITFIDPHGLRYAAGIGDEKILLSKKIKKIEAQLGGSHNVVLNSFILSTTPYNEDGWWRELGKDELADKNIYFMESLSIEEILGKILNE